jgi:hypothetical protein
VATKGRQDISLSKGGCLAVYLKEGTFSLRVLMSFIGKLTFITPKLAITHEQLVDLMGAGPFRIEYKEVLIFTNDGSI